jgi:hypothetical protein
MQFQVSRGRSRSPPTPGTAKQSAGFGRYQSVDRRNQSPKPPITEEPRESVDSTVSSEYEDRDETVTLLEPATPLAIAATPVQPPEMVLPVLMTRTVKAIILAWKVCPFITTIGPVTYPVWPYTGLYLKRPAACFHHSYYFREDRTIMFACTRADGYMV